MNKKIGAYSFIAGILIALVLGIFADYIRGSAAEILVSLLVVLGFVVGFLNVADKQSQEFLIVGAILVIIAYTGVGAAASLGKIMVIGKYITAVFTNLMMFVIPALIIVGLKDIVRLAKTP
jgi:hypothetical protein